MGGGAVHRGAQRRKRTGRFASNLAVVVVSVCLTLVVAEIALRAGHYGERLPVIRADERTRRALADGWLREDRRLLWRVDECDAYCRTIRHAHPDNPRAAPHPKTKKRILCLGDSCTFFGGEEMPPYSLCLELLYGRTGGVEVINAGVPGYSSSQGLAWLRTELLDYGPDLVIVYFGWNDHWIARPAPDDRCMKSMELSPLRLARLAGVVVRTVSGGGKSGGGKSLRVPIERYRDNLREIDRLLRARGTKCLFLTAPAVYGRETREELIAAGHIDETTDYESLHRDYNDVVRATADEGAAVLDLAAAFEQSDDPASLMRDDGIHLADTGIGLVAATLRDYIETNGLLE